MNRLTTSAIILSRTNFGEADRILTVLTPDYGKLKLMARGVRKSKSKLAGSVELFCVSDITFIRGRGEISTLVSARLQAHYKNIVADINRVNLGYEMLKLIDKNTEDEVESDYFNLLCRSLEALNNTEVGIDLAGLYYKSNLLKLAGQTPNLSAAANGESLVAGKRYNFSPNDGFVDASNGQYGESEIKYLRLLFSGNSPVALARVEADGRLIQNCSRLITSMLSNYLRV